jgi:hypothetical protein
MATPNEAALIERITELEAALRLIADGEIDDGGCRRVRSDSIKIALGAVG